MLRTHLPAHRHFVLLAPSPILLILTRFLLRSAWPSSLYVLRSVALADKTRWERRCQTLRYCLALRSRASQEATAASSFAVRAPRPHVPRHALLRAVATASARWGPCPPQLTALPVLSASAGGLLSSCYAVIRQANLVRVDRLEVLSVASPALEGGRMLIVDCIATIGQLGRSPCLFLGWWGTAGSAGRLPAALWHYLLSPLLTMCCERCRSTSQNCLPCFCILCVRTWT